MRGKTETMDMNVKPVGFAKPSDLTRLGVGVDISQIDIKRGRSEFYSIPLYTRPEDWPVMR